MTIGQTFRNVAELAQGKVPASKHPIFKKIFNVKVFEPECRVSPELSQKYGVDMENIQQVVSIQNRVTSDLTWWNPARKTKPQNFKAASSAASLDPTGGGGHTKCDFCGWQNLTAEDTFGRIEGPYAVTASNLFKYGAPYQGVVLFKHHDPLSFNFLQLSDLLNVADGWFYKAMIATVKGRTSRGSSSYTNTTEEGVDEEEELSVFPLLVWNCLGRAGASQYHGHAQVMVSGVPFPAMKRESDAVVTYQRIYKKNDDFEDKIEFVDQKSTEKKYQGRKASDTTTSGDYYQDLVAAHEVVGLARRLVLPNSTKTKNSGGIGGDDQKIEESNKFNFNFDEGVIWDDKISTITTTALRSSPTATAHVSLCPAKDAEIVIHGSSLTCPAFQMVFYAALRALIDDLGVQSFNAGIHNIPIPQHNNRNKRDSDKNEDNKYAVPVVARVVCRGRQSSSGGASDFGGLEVFAGASIGHTDPWTVMEALDTSLKRALKENTHLDSTYFSC